MSVFRTLGEVLDCDSQITILSPPSFDGPQLLRFTSVCSSLYLLTCAHCALCSPSISQCSWPRTSLPLLEEGHNHPIVRFAYLCHMIGEKLVFVSFLYIKLFELGVKVALSH